VCVFTFTTPGLPHGDYHPDTDHLNVAESSGAVHRNSMVEQWALLNASAQKYPAFDFAESWKVITVCLTRDNFAASAPLGQPAHSAAAPAPGVDDSQ
jgi:hypothetical protein